MKQFVFDSDDDAYQVLDKHLVQVTRQGIIIVHAGKEPLPEAKAAIEYLCEEWDHVCIVEGVE